MTAVERSTRRLQMGRVVVRTFQLINDHPLLFATLSIVMAIPSLILHYQQSPLSNDRLYSLSYFATVVAFGIAFYLFTAGVAVSVFHRRGGARAALKDGFAEMARDFLPLAAIATISSFVILAAIFASAADPMNLVLLIPGIYIQIITLIVVPIRTIERAGFIASFERGFELTRGHRWRILLLYVAWSLFGLALTLMVYWSLGNPASAELDGSGRAALVSLVIVDVFNGIISGAMSVALYLELRLIKEGIAPEAVAAVFE